MAGPTPATCLNCGTPLYGVYCAKCGQKVPRPDLTLGDLVHELTHELSHWDGKIPQTLKALFFHPGLLTQDFLAGRRARWLPPLRLYLVCSVAYFLSGPLVETVTHRSARELARITVTNPGDTTVTPDIRREIEQSPIARTFGVGRIERAATHAGEFNKLFQAAFPKAMFVLLPLFALLTRIAWSGSRLRYPAHLYPALHLHAAWFGAFAVVTLLTVLGNDTVDTVLAVGGLAYCAWYALVTLRRVFGQSWFATIAKTAVVGAAYMFVLAAVSLGVLAYALWEM